MATNWEGYLLKARKNDQDEWSTFPLKYVNEASWKTKPNQREEIKAYRDENNRNLTRVTASGKKSAITFETRGNLHLADKIKIQKFFTTNELDATQRKVHLKYWNDEANDYKEGNFYRTDIEFTIKKITDTDIIYEPISIELVEY